METNATKTAESMDPMWLINKALFSFKKQLSIELSASCYEAGLSRTGWHVYRGADKSLARPTSQCIFFDGENISFDASLVII